MLRLVWLVLVWHGAVALVEHKECETLGADSVCIDVEAVGCGQVHYNMTLNHQLIFTSVGSANMSVTLQMELAGMECSMNLHVLGDATPRGFLLCPVLEGWCGSKYISNPFECFEAGTMCEVGTCDECLTTTACGWCLVSQQCLASNDDDSGPACDDCDEQWWINRTRACPDVPPEAKDDDRVGLVLGCIFGGVGLVGLGTVGGIWWAYRRRRRREVALGERPLLQ